MLSSSRQRKQTQYRSLRHNEKPLTAQSGFAARRALFLLPLLLLAAAGFTAGVGSFRVPRFDKSNSKPLERGLGLSYRRNLKGEPGQGLGSFLSSLFARSLTCPDGSQPVVAGALRGRRAVLAVVGVQTGFGSGERRRALRNAWMPSSPEEAARSERATGMVLKFILGHTADPGLEAAVQREADEFRDIVRIDVEESYVNLNHKTLVFFRAMLRTYDAEFYVKADDDIYLRPDRLATLLARERSDPSTYLGCFKKGPVITDPNLKWFEPLGYILGSEYFLHAYGPIYALSADVVASLAATRNGSLRMFSNEDVTVGAWMLAWNVTYEDNRELCATACTATSIAVWDLPRCSGLCDSPKRIPELHSDPLCSKSPTLPNE